MGLVFLKSPVAQDAAQKQPPKVFCSLFPWPQDNVVLKLEFLKERNPEDGEKERNPEDGGKERNPEDEKK